MEQGGIPGDTAAAWAMWGGLALVLANLVLNPKYLSQLQALWNPKKAAEVGKADFVYPLFMLIFVAVLVIAAGLGGRIGELVLAILGAIWVVFILATWEEWRNIFDRIRGEGHEPPSHK